MPTEKRTREVSFNVFFFLIIVAVAGFIAAAAMLITLLFLWSLELLIAALLAIIGSIGYFCSLGVLHIKPSKDDAGKKKKSKKGFEMPSKEEAYAMVKGAQVPPDVAADIIVKGYDAAPRSELGARLPILSNLTGQFRAIGQALNDSGGLAMMNGTFEKVNLKNPEAAKTLKVLWDRIGEWKGF